LTIVELHGVKLALPDGHSLLQRVRMSPGYLEHLGRLSAAVERKYPQRGFVDLGADVGDAVAAVRAHASLPVLSIEGVQFCFELLQQNIRHLRDVEFECAHVESTIDSAAGRFHRLEDILARHPRFLPSKVLKLGPAGGGAGIIVDALNWMAAARPVLYWRACGSTNGGEPFGGDVLARLFAIGYRSALVFDSRGNYLQTAPVSDPRLLTDLCDYLPAGDATDGVWDICAFHEEDSDLCVELRQAELEVRAARRASPSSAPQPGLLQAVVEAQFAAHRTDVAQAVHDAVALAIREQQGSRERELTDALTNRTVEAQSLRAQLEMERYRLQTALWDQEKRTAAKEVEIQKLQALVRDLLGNAVPGAGSGTQASNKAAARWQGEAEDLKAQLADKQAECDQLKHDMDNSLALRAARSLHWILGPLRRLLAPGDADRGGRV